MRAAPAVSVLCHRAGAWRWLQALTPGLASAAVLAWVAGHLQQPGVASPWLVLAVSLLVTSLAWRQARQEPVRLSWDGQTWAADGAAGQLELKIDLGRWLLLCMHRRGADSGAVWIAVSAAEAGPSLHALRAALYARVPQPRLGKRPREPGDTAAAG